MGERCEHGNWSADECVTCQRATVARLRASLDAAERERDDLTKLRDHSETRAKLAELERKRAVNEAIEATHDASVRLDMAERSVATLTADLARARGVVEALPRCHACERIATREMVSDEWTLRSCDEHTRGEEELPYAAAVRAWEGGA